MSRLPSPSTGAIRAGLAALIALVLVGAATASLTAQELQPGIGISGPESDTNPNGSGKKGGGDCGGVCQDACPLNNSRSATTGDPVLLPLRSFMQTEPAFSMQERGVRFVLERSHISNEFFDRTLTLRHDVSGSLQRGRNSIFGQPAGERNLEIHSGLLRRPTGLESSIATKALREKTPRGGCGGRRDHSLSLAAFPRRCIELDIRAAWERNPSR